MNTMKKISVVLAILSVAVIATAMAFAGESPSPATQAKASGDWPQWLGPSRTGWSAETGLVSTWPADGMTPLWKKTVGMGFGSVAIADGRLYAMGYKDKEAVVWCLDAATGMELWKTTYPAEDAGKNHPGTRSTPSVDGKRVFVMSNDGQLKCLGVDKGDILWSKDVEKDLGGKRPTWGWSGSPLVVGDLLILDIGPVVALKKATGEPAWRSKDHPASYSSPVRVTMGERQLIATFPADGLLVVDAADGKEVARRDWKTAYDVHATTPVFDNGRFFISSGYNVGSALVDIRGGEPKDIWNNKNLCMQCNQAIPLDGYLYGLSGQAGSNGVVRCVELATGELKWELKGVKVGALTIADGKLFVLADGGTLILAEASPDGYKELGRGKAISGKCWTAPVIAGGRMYVRNHDPGELVCYDVRASAASSAPAER